MTPVEIKTGRSFKGLAAYLLHDVREEGQAASSTAERVAWAQSFNLDGADPERAWRRMADTAMSADVLKEAAGIKKGKVPTKTVYHFSLNFSPKDEPDEELQKLAVTEALQALGLDRYQALAVSHRDKEHQHVHVMVNLINPANGLSAASKQPDGRASPLTNSHRKLSSWAERFERQHGLEITAGRLANANKRAEGEEVDAKRKSRQEYEQAQREGEDKRLAWLRAQEQQKAADIAAEGRVMSGRHHDEWTALKAGYAVQKRELRLDKDKAIPQAIERIKDDRRRSWDALAMVQRSERQDYTRDEQSFLGRLWHGVTVFKAFARKGEALTGLLAAGSPEERRALLDNKHRQERDQLAKAVKAEIRQTIHDIREEHAGALVQARHGFMNACQDLKGNQDQARAALRERWRSYNVHRRAAFEKAQARVVVANDRGRGQSQEQGLGRSRGLSPRM